MSASSAAEARAGKPSFLRRWGLCLVLLAPMVVLLAVTFAAPLALFFKFSFHPYVSGRIDETTWTLGTYWRFLTDRLYQVTVYDTLRLAVLSTALSVLVGYPLSYALWKMRNPTLQKTVALIIFAPVLVSVVVRSYGWTVLLADRGAVNYLLIHLGLIDKPLSLTYNLTGVLISMVHVFLPFVVFPILASMMRLDPSIREAAEDLGAGWWMAFRRVTLPLTLPGVVAGAQIAFTLTLGAFVTPAILGGGRVLVLPIQIYSLTSEVNWPMAAVGGLCLLVIALVAIVLFNRLLRYSEVR